MAKAIHMMIRVLDLDRSIAFYRTALGLDVADRFDFDSFTLVYLRNAEADFEVELTLNKGRTEPYSLGDGYGHVAFCVDDLDGHHARLGEAGHRAAADQGVPPRRRADGPFLLHPGPGRLQDRGSAAARPLPLSGNGQGGREAMSKRSSTGGSSCRSAGSTAAAVVRSRAPPPSWPATGPGR